MPQPINQQCEHKNKLYKNVDGKVVKTICEDCESEFPNQQSIEDAFREKSDFDKDFPLDDRAMSDILKFFQSVYEEQGKKDKDLYEKAHKILIERYEKKLKALED